MKTRTVHFNGLNPIWPGGGGGGGGGEEGEAEKARADFNFQ